MRARTLAAALALAALARPAVAQGPPADTSGARTIRLDIAERRIEARDYDAAVALEAADADGRADVRVGAGVRARALTLGLRNVRGLVRLRATLGPLAGVLARPVRAASPTPSPNPSQELP